MLQKVRREREMYIDSVVVYVQCSVLAISASA